MKKPVDFKGTFLGFYIIGNILSFGNLMKDFWSKSPKKM
ncbi:hypothetical protein bmyco0003_49040 [Bacillus pseudomycoides]|nr:hypothetical protein bmyco0003_49040 [Bacillus pseudomycoides]